LAVKFFGSPLGDPIPVRDGHPVFDIKIHFRVDVYRSRCLASASACRAIHNGGELAVHRLACLLG